VRSVRGSGGAILALRKYLFRMAERVRFELTSPVKGLRFSSLGIL
jgi:hypothetical protein